MAKGIIYLMTTAVPGLVKIGKTGSSNFESRMYNLEHDGYRNVTVLKREFAIEVEDFDEKEKMLHTIFEKSRVSDTELFALDKNIAIQLLSSLDGKVIFPKEETKDEIFDEATENGSSKILPDGTYTMNRKKKSDNLTVSATATVRNGVWTLLAGSQLGITEDKGLSKKVRGFRLDMPVDDKGVLLENVELGECSPSFASDLVIYGSSDGWESWKNASGETINIYRSKSTEET